MNNRIIELAAIRLAPGRTEEELVAASDRFQEQFLALQPGFLRRELARLDEHRFLDLVHWRSMADAEAVGGKIAGSSACQAYFAVMAFDPANPMEGVSHYQSLALYPAAAER